MLRGPDATGIVGAGGEDLAVLLVSETVHAVGVDFAGSIAAEIRFVQVLFRPAMRIPGFRRLPVPPDTFFCR
jgi:hypothetical protein